MLKSFKGGMILLLMSFLLTSCYTYKFDVGEGAQKGITITAKNHYYVYGLAPGGQSDHKEMSGNAADYSVKIEHTFVDGLINAITFGIYTPTTTTVTK